MGASGAGQVEDKCNYDVEAGATVTLKAEPDLDSKPDPPDPQRGGERSFVRWSDEDCWTTNPCEFVMPNEPVSMVAIFSPAEVEISIASNNGGRITGPAPPAASRLTATTEAGRASAGSRSGRRSSSR